MLRKIFGLPNKSKDKANKGAGTTPPNQSRAQSIRPPVFPTPKDAAESLRQNNQLAWWYFDNMMPIMSYHAVGAPIKPRAGGMGAVTTWGLLDFYDTGHCVRSYDYPGGNGMQHFVYDYRIEGDRIFLQRRLNYQSQVFRTDPVTKQKIRCTDFDNAIFNAELELLDIGAGVLRFKKAVSNQKDGQNLRIESAFKTFYPTWLCTNDTDRTKNYMNAMAVETRRHLYTNIIPKAWFGTAHRSPETPTEAQAKKAREEREALFESMQSQIPTGKGRNTRVPKSNQD